MLLVGVCLLFLLMFVDSCSLFVVFVRWVLFVACFGLCVVRCSLFVVGFVFFVA